MEKLPAMTGWIWVKEGFSLFRKQPTEISTLFLAYVFAILAVGFLPLLGQVLPLVLTPVFSMAFMQACVHIEQGKKVYPNLLLTGFRMPALRNLLKLGVLYLIAAVVAVALSALVDGGLFWLAVSGQKALEPETIHNSNVPLAMMFSSAAYTLATMAFWYAAPLITWKNMSVGKAIFYSFFSVKHAYKAFAVYGTAWFAIGMTLLSIVSSIAALIVGKAFAVIIAWLAALLILITVIYCSFYPTYISLFGRPEQPAREPAE